VCYDFESERVLIGGDLIICGAVGRTDLPDSNSIDLDSSIRKIMKLPLSTRLLPGHCDVSTLGDELRSNEYVRTVVEQS
jgi:glyoxylase-like metal-dependent hydrolase (beta-lactamase superfamily II)